MVRRRCRVRALKLETGAPPEVGGGGNLTPQDRLWRHGSHIVGIIQLSSKGFLEVDLHSVTTRTADEAGRHRSVVNVQKRNVLFSSRWSSTSTSSR